MMRTSLRSRHGFSMIEMLVVIVVLGIIGGALTRSMLTMQRGTERQTQQADMQSDLRASAGLLPAELREVAGGIDILAARPDSVAYRAMRNTAFVCGIPAANILSVLDETMYGYRAIDQDRDFVFVYVEGDPSDMADDSWDAYDITGKAATTCGGEAATLLTLGTNLAATPELGAPIRTFETMTLKLYTSDGRGWLGARSMSAGEPIQPVLGPLDVGTGLQLVYRDAAGTDLGAAPVLADIRGIDVVVLGETSSAVSTGYDSRSIRQDSVSVRVRLRNGY